MKIREAKLKDIRELSKLMRKIISTTPYYSQEAKLEEVKKHNSAALKQYLEDKKYYICFIAESGDKVMGFIIGRNEAGVFWADWLGVRKSERGYGIAEALMIKLESSLHKKGIHKVWCDTRNNNKESINLLLKLNYKKLGLFKNGWYKQDFFIWEKNVK
jgi:ribosomal protein S18 acetylase RimI-like enzyme